MSHFNVFDDAENLIHDIWVADIPTFAWEPGQDTAHAFHDHRHTTETIRVLAELIFYSKKDATDDKEWIRQNFIHYEPSDFLPSLHQVLHDNFDELIPNASGSKKKDRPRPLLSKTTKTGELQNYLYLTDHKGMPSEACANAYLSACGLNDEHTPKNHNYLLQIYNKSSIKLDRLIALSHLLIAGAQSEKTISQQTLVNEFRLQEKVKELRSAYLTEYATMRLAFAKRQHGLHMLDTLDKHTHYKHKHETTLEAIADRLSIGTEQYPAIIKKTQKAQRLFSSAGQVLLGGFLATEIISTVAEWAAIYFHKNQFAFFTELMELTPSAPSEALHHLHEQYYQFEMVSVYISVVTVLVVIGLTIYFKSKNKSLSHDEGHTSGHH